MADERLIKKGRSEPLEGLLEQARASVALAEGQAAALETAGWPASNTEARGATTSEQAAITESKALVRKLRLALPKALRGAGADVDEKAFHAGEALARSTPRLSAYLLKIRPSVAKLEQALTPFFNQQSPVALLDAAKAALDSADTVQETTLAALPTQTAQVYEAKGLLLELIEDMNRSGKIAFDGNASMMALFNKDILLRARGEKKKPGGAVQEAPPT